MDSTKSDKEYEVRKYFHTAERFEEIDPYLDLVTYQLKRGKKLSTSEFNALKITMLNGLKAQIWARIRECESSKNTQMIHEIKLLVQIGIDHELIPSPTTHQFSYWLGGVLTVEAHRVPYYDKVMKHKYAEKSQFSKRKVNIEGINSLQTPNHNTQAEIKQKRARNKSQSEKNKKKARNKSGGSKTILNRSDNLHNDTNTRTCLQDAITAVSPEGINMELLQRALVKSIPPYGDTNILAVNTEIKLDGPSQPFRLNIFIGTKSTYC